MTSWGHLLYDATPGVQDQLDATPVVQEQLDVTPRGQGLLHTTPGGGKNCPNIRSDRMETGTFLKCHSDHFRTTELQLGGADI